MSNYNTYNSIYFNACYTTKEIAEAINCSSAAKLNEFLKLVGIIKKTPVFEGWILTNKAKKYNLGEDKFKKYRGRPTMSVRWTEAGKAFIEKLWIKLDIEDLKDFDSLVY